VFELLSSAIMDTDTVADLRDKFRETFHEYLAQGDRMAAILRRGDIPDEDRVQAIHAQQVALNHAQRRYERARQRYVEAVMGQLTGLSAMGIKLN
jgi:hypothetical protein